VSGVRRREFISLIGGAAATWPLAVGAQQLGKLPTIGFWGSNTPASQGQWVAAFLQRLRELGWIEDAFSSDVSLPVPTGYPGSAC
jgi:hypothetical protein